MSDPRHEAFATALKELFKRYPLPNYKSAKVRQTRENDRRTALRNARSGSPLYMVDCFIYHVPYTEVHAVHALIYG